jgi:hypothetical protein
VLIGAGSDADQHAKQLIHLAVEGARFGSDARLMTPTARFVAFSESIQ